MATTNSSCVFPPPVAVSSSVSPTTTWDTRRRACGLRVFIINRRPVKNFVPLDLVTILALQYPVRNIQVIRRDPLRTLRRPALSPRHQRGGKPTTGHNASPWSHHRLTTPGGSGMRRQRRKSRKTETLSSRRRRTKRYGETAMSWSRVTASHLPRRQLLR